MTCVFCRDNINRLEYLKSSQGDVAQITDGCRHHVKHSLSSAQRLPQTIKSRGRAAMPAHQPKTFAKTSGATIVASDSITNRGVFAFNFPHVIFSLGTAPEYDPKLVVESLIWQK